MSVDRVTISRATPGRRNGRRRFAEQTFRDAFQAGNTLEDMDAYRGIAFAEPLQPEQIADAAIATLLPKTVLPLRVMRSSGTPAGNHHLRIEVVLRWSGSVRMVDPDGGLARAVRQRALYEWRVFRPG